MIIRRVAGDLLLITQFDHSLLAGRIMSAWRAGGLPERPTRAQVLEATRQHDFGWQTVDAAPSVNPETGAPYEFVNAPLEHRQGVWPRALDYLAPQDPYVAALVAHHAATVYRRYGTSPEWETFFPEMERRRDDLLARQTLSLDTLLDDYIFVGMGDLWSLVFCNGWTEPHEREGYRARLHVDAASSRTGDAVPGGWLAITPDPFARGRVPIEIAARRIPDRRYVSDADLRNAISQSTIVQLCGTAAGFPPSAS